MITSSWISGRIYLVTHSHYKGQCTHIHQNTTLMISLHQFNTNEENNHNILGRLTRLVPHLNRPLNQINYWCFRAVNSQIRDIKWLYNSIYFVFLIMSVNNHFLLKLRFWNSLKNDYIKFISFSSWNTGPVQLSKIPSVTSANNIPPSTPLTNDNIPKQWRHLHIRTINSFQLSSPHIFHINYHIFVKILKILKTSRPHFFFSPNHTSI